MIEKTREKVKREVEVDGFKIICDICSNSISYLDDGPDKKGDYSIKNKNVIGDCSRNFKISVCEYAERIYKSETKESISIDICFYCFKNSINSKLKKAIKKHLKVF